MLIVERNKVLRAAKRGGNFLEWVDEFYDGYASFSQEYLGPSISAIASHENNVHTFGALAAAEDHGDRARSQLIELTGVATPNTLHELVKGQKPPSADRLVDAIFKGGLDNAAA